MIGYFWQQLQPPACGGLATFRALGQPTGRTIKNPLTFYGVSRFRGVPETSRSGRLRVCSRDSLCRRVVELILAGSAEAGLDATVPPQPLDDAGQLSRHEAFLRRAGQHEQLPGVVLGEETQGMSARRTDGRSRYH